MDKKETEVENQEVEQVDIVAERAAKIGEELGVEKEEVPDYDVREEADDRLAKERHPKAEKPEQKERQQLSNKEKRELRKKRISEKFNEKDAVIEAQKLKLAELEKWQAEVNGKLSGINKAEVEKAYNESVTAFNKAEQEHASAFTDGDGVKATAAMRAMYDAQRRIDDLTVYKKQLEKLPEVAPQQQASNQPEPIMLRKKAAWEAQNKWFKPDGRDSDTEVARAISGAIAAEGFDPKTDDFWDELSERLMNYLPDKVNIITEEDEDEDDDKPAVKVKKRTAPPVGGGSPRGDIKGKVAVSLPTAYVNTLKANGLWDDVEKRNRLIKGYLEGVKKNQSN